MEFSNRRTRRLPEVPIIPMIDTMFFLLVFFILTSLNIIKLEGINVNLPNAANSTAQPKTPDLTVSITSAQQVYVNGKQAGQGQSIGPMLLTALQQKLGHAPTEDDLSKQSIVINADGSVPHRLVVQSIDQARGVHINKFAIATTSDKTKAANVTAAPAAATP